MTTRGLLLFSIGPIQDFIASARRCQDLWFGSHLLGTLAWAAAVEARRLTGDDAVIFPGIDEEDDSDEARSIANKILVRVPDGVAGTDVAKELRRRVRSELLLHWKKVEGEILRAGGSTWLRRDPARQQIEDLIEIQWVFVEEGVDYAASREQAERLLAARKNTKAFAQPAWAAPVPKCALDGVRESVIDETAFPSPPDPVVSARLFQIFGAHPRERLSAVGLLKRRGVGDNDERGRFLSTSDVAIQPFLRGLDRCREVDGSWRELRDELRALGMDELDALVDAPGDIFFRGRLADRANELGATPEQLRAAENAQDQFLGSVRRAGLRPAEPIPYYGLLMADGDRMGSAIDEARDCERHRALSKALFSFAGGVPAILENHEGSCIYAGGDDVLALVPLHLALDCASVMAESFRKALLPFGTIEGSPTLSVGLAFGHHLDPVDQARANAKVAEHLAKRDRNSLAIVLDKRGGPPLRVVGRWDAAAPLHERLRWMVDLHIREGISDKAAYELARLETLTSEPLGGRQVHRRDLQGVLQAELRRILVRKQPDRGRQAQLEQEVESTLTRWAEVEGGEGLDPARLGRELQLARILADAKAQAGGPRRDGGIPTEEPA